MREHLVAECETRYPLADRGDDTCRFDAECQRWLSADVPVAYADDLVPVAHPCGAYRDHQLVRRGRSRRRELEHVNLAAKRVEPADCIRRVTATYRDPRVRRVPVGLIPVRA